MAIATPSSLDALLNALGALDADDSSYYDPTITPADAVLDRLDMATRLHGDRIKHVAHHPALLCLVGTSAMEHGMDNTVAVLSDYGKWNAFASLILATEDSVLGDRNVEPWPEFTISNDPNVLRAFAEQFVTESASDPESRAYALVQRLYDLAVPTPECAQRVSTIINDPVFIATVVDGVRAGFLPVNALSLLAAPNELAAFVSALLATEDLVLEGGVVFA